MNYVTVIIQIGGAIITQITSTGRGGAEREARETLDGLYGAGSWSIQTNTAGRNVVNTRAIYWNVEVSK